MRYRGDRTPMVLLATGLVTGLLTTGCASVQSGWSSFHTDAKLTLEIEASSMPGEYVVSGVAPLSNDTEIAVLAIRNLYIDTRTESDHTEQTYSILAYSSVTVVDGAWETDLNLWQVSPDGRYQEAWQLESTEMDVDFTPDERVIVLATLNPVDTLAKLEEELAVEKLRFSEDIVRSNVDGDRYAQIYRDVVVPLPTGIAPSDVASLDDGNLGWGDRYLIPPEPENPTRLEQPSDRITDAPISLDEMLR